MNSIGQLMGVEVSVGNDSFDVGQAKRLLGDIALGPRGCPCRNPISFVDQDNAWVGYQDRETNLESTVRQRNSEKRMRMPVLSMLADVEKSYFAIIRKPFLERPRIDLISHGRGAASLLANVCLDCDSRTDR